MRKEICHARVKINVLYAYNIIFTKIIISRMIYNISYDFKKKPPDYVINKLDYLTENYKCFILPLHYCTKNIHYIHT